MKRLILISLLSVLAVAQTAEVYDLTPDESTEGRKLYAEMQHANAAYADYQRRMEAKYLPQSACGWADTKGNHGDCGKSGDFDASFRHIVPKALDTTWYWNGNQLDNYCATHVCNGSQPAPGGVPISGDNLTLGQPITNQIVGRNN